MDLCGIAAVDEVLTGSVQEDREYVGVIFVRSGIYGFTRGVPNGQREALPDEASAPPGMAVVGTYHTHGNARGSGEIFSPEDRAFHNLRHWTAYLGTPSGAILRFDSRVRPADENPWLAVFGGTVVTLRPGRP
jgi:proteasome lid subunit RPN8/RPN11